MSLLHRFFVISAALLGILLVSPAQAESACKGLTQSSCANKSSCTWVDGYTRKDGKKVNAYCRKVSGKKSDAKKATSKPDSKKTSDKKPTKKEPAKQGKQPTQDKSKPAKKSDKKDTKKKPADSKKSS